MGQNQGWKLTANLYNVRLCLFLSPNYKRCIIIGKYQLLALHKWVCNTAATIRCSTIIALKFRLMMFEGVFVVRVMCDISHRALWKLAHYVELFSTTRVGKNSKGTGENPTTCWNQSWSWWTNLKFCHAIWFVAFVQRHLCTFFYIINGNLSLMAKKRIIYRTVSPSLNKTNNE